MMHTFDIGSDTFRFVNLKDDEFVETPADKIATHLRHTGWYTDDFMDERLRGHVFRPVQCPDCDGDSECDTCDDGQDYPAIYYYGYVSNVAPDAAVVSVDPTDDKLDAAIWADHAAKTTAERDREYSRGYRAGSKAAELVDELLELGEDYIKLGLTLPERGPVMDAAAEKMGVLKKDLSDTVGNLYPSAEKNDAFLSGYRDYAGSELDMNVVNRYIEGV